MRLFTLAAAACVSLLLAACVRTPVAAPTQAYVPQSLAFHRYTLDIPADMDTGKGLQLMAFGGHNWRVYPAASAKQVQGLVHKRAQELNRLRQDANQASLGLKLSLYRVVDGGEGRWGVLGRHPINLNPAAPDTTYADWYVYHPGRKYVLHGQQAALPESVDAVGTAQEFLRNIVPATPAHIADDKAVVVGPVAWLQPDGQPYIRYRLDSPQQHLSIELDVGPAGPDQSSLNRLKQERMRDKLREAGRSSRVLVKRLTQAAGMAGHEDCIRVSAAPAPMLWCSWISAGQAQAPGSPSIDLNLKYHAVGSMDVQQGLAAWRQLLGSLRRRSAE